MTTAQIKLAPDLRRALDKLPKPNGVPEVSVTVEVSADDQPSTGASPHTVSAVAEFHRGVLTTSEGSLPVWVYEGHLALAKDATPADHDPVRVAAWVREQLGPRCVAVDVDEVEEHEARVRVAATIGAGQKPD